MRDFANPIIRGFNPDPSVCRVGEDIYLVTSTFEFFPGVPVYHSRDLANWELIGHCLNRPSQLPLTGCRASGGIYAPTIRHNEGMFYMATTNVTGGGNFLVHARDAAGPWSETAWVAQGGIDPSLLFHDDGRCYFHSAASWEGRPCILQCEIDPLTGEMLTPSRPLSFGGGGRFPEAPHLYKLFGRYYLMLAEGGTEYGHMVTIFRADSPWGPFEPCPHNPILTHRGVDAAFSPIQCVGHAELFEDARGKWWIAALGVRKLPYAMLHNLGRETFLGEVSWDEDGWPVVNGCGQLRERIGLDVPDGTEQNSDNFSDNFVGAALKPDYCHVRNPHIEHYQIANGELTLTGGEKLCTTDASPTFLGVRQNQFRAEAAVCIRLEEGALAGLCAYYNDEHHYALCASRQGGRTRITLRKRIYDLEVETALAECADGALWLRILADERNYAFEYRAGDGGWARLGEGAVAALCTEVTRTMTFTGTFLGLFCERGQASFSMFSMQYPGDGRA